MHSNALLLDLYAAPLEPARWTFALDRLCQETGARSGVLQVLKPDGGRLRTQWVACDSWTQALNDVYNVRIADEGNDRLQLDRALRATDRVVRDDDLFGADKVARRRLQGQLATMGLGRFMGVLHACDGDRYVSLALHRAAGERGDFSELSAHRLAGLVPHASQAVALSERLTASRPVQPAGSRICESLRCGLLVCGPDGQLHWMNRAARTLLAGAAPLHLRQGMLCAEGVRSQVALRRDLAQLAATKPADTERRYLAVGDGARRLHLAMQSLNVDAEGDQQAAGSVLIAVSGAASDAPMPAQALAGLFQLTPAESQLLAALVAGASLASYAACRGVSLGTVRVQLKQVLGKTGTNRQSELVRLVLSSAAAQLAPAQALVNCRPA